MIFKSIPDNKINNYHLMIKILTSNLMIKKMINLKKKTKIPQIKKI